MIQIYRLHPGTRVAAIADMDSACLMLSSRPVRMGLHMDAQTAAAISIELATVLPSIPGSTCRPVPPSRIGSSGKPYNWAAIVGRMRLAKPIYSDAEAVSELLSYLGVTTS